MIAGDVFPRRNLPGAAEQWGRTVEGGIDTLFRETQTLRQFVQAQNRDTASTLASIATQVNTLSDVTEKLADASRVYYADSGNTTWTLSTQDWTSSPDGPSVVASSLSGRFRVTVTIAANDGAAAGVFSAPGFARTRAMGGSPAAVRSRVGVVGGVNFISTSSAFWIVELEPGVEHTFQAHGLNLNGTAEFPVFVHGLTLTVEPLF